MKDALGHSSHLRWHTFWIPGCAENDAYVRRRTCLFDRGGTPAALRK